MAKCADGPANPQVMRQEHKGRIVPHATRFAWVGAIDAGPFGIHDERRRLSDKPSETESFERNQGHERNQPRLPPLTS
jgi:hypothetical protein